MRNVFWEISYFLRARKREGYACGVGRVSSLKETFTPPIRGARKLYNNPMIAAVINPPTKAIIGTTTIAPTPKIRPSQPRLKPRVVEEGTLANRAPKNNA